MTNVVAAFADEHVERLTGVSRAQLRHWDRSGFYVPAYSLPDRAVPFSRVYSFKDVVALRVLNVLRNQFKVSLQHLREVSERLSHLSENDRWTETKLWVLNRKVVWQEPGTGKPQEVISGQYIVPVVLHVVVEDTKRDIEALNQRQKSQEGQFQKSRLVSRGARVFAGTRIPVSSVARYLSAGYSVKQVIADYPDLREADVLAIKSELDKQAA